VTLSPRRHFLFALATIGWVAYVLLGGLIIVNSLPYFTEGDRMPFIGEKGALGDSPAWRIALLVHVAAGIVCLAAAVGQFFRSLLRRFPWLHRWMGRAYVWSTLLFLCPSGVYLALFAKGGLAGQTGFLLLGGLMFHSTLSGQRAILRCDTPAHIRWMIRSFAMAATALTFRVLHLAFAVLGIAYETNYLTALWLSIALNFAMAESVIRFLPITRKTRTIKDHHETDPSHPHPSPCPRFPRRCLFLRRPRAFQSESF
jgi:hypothetical protein